MFVAICVMPQLALICCLWLDSFASGFGCVDLGLMLAVVICCCFWQFQIVVVFGRVGLCFLLAASSWCVFCSKQNVSVDCDCVFFIFGCVEPWTFEILPDYAFAWIY